MMQFTLTRPCAKCPFRTDVPPYLRTERAQEIADGLEQGSTFTCHQTTVAGEEDEDGFEEMVDGPNAQMCAGALIILEKMEYPNQIMRIAERIGSYDPSKLDMDAPVYTDLYEWVDAQEA